MLGPLTLSFSRKRESKMPGLAELQGLLSSLDLRVKPEDDRGKENVRPPYLVILAKAGIQNAWTRRITRTSFFPGSPGQARR